MPSAPVSTSEIRDIAIFHSIQKSHAAAIASVSMRMHYEPHTIIMRAGVALKRLGVIRHGSITRLFNLDNHLIPVEHLHRGALWGHHALIQPSARMTTLLRTENHGAECIEIPIMQLLALFEKMPELGATVAHALLKAQATQKTTDDLTLSCLYGINHLLQGASDTHDTAAAILRLTADTLGAHGAFLVRFNPTARRITILEHSGSPSLAGASYSLLSDTILATVYTTRTSMIIGAHNAERKFTKMAYYRPTMTIIPLIANTEVIGALAITDSVRHGGFTTHDSGLLNVIGGMLIPLLVAMEHQDLHAQDAYLKRTYIGSFQHPEHS